MDKKLVKHIFFLFNSVGENEQLFLVQAKHFLKSFSSVDSAIHDFNSIRDTKREQLIDLALEIKKLNTIDLKHEHSIFTYLRYVKSSHTADIIYMGW